ncbi:MAG TPA: NAD(+)/NADH kinase [Negativicutes bacterium]|nr:NAD(+)/NADH kinase [Negativicutes bacterium]
MLTIGLFPNTKKQGVSTVLDWLIHFLQEKKVQVLMPEEAATVMNHPELGCSRERLGEELAIALTLGGDGTLLSTAREVAPHGVAVCGINMGQLGFLTEIELSELAPSMERIIRGDYSLEERPMLEAVIDRPEGPIVAASALNDVVVSKGGFSRMIRLKLFIDDHLTANYPADGLIVSTSTGSTGYSLSAGGPIVSPNLKVTIITPICPHSLNTRSLVVSDKEEIRIETLATHEDIVLTVDGQTLYNLRSGDKILVRSSPFHARFVKFNGSSFYESLRTKLRRSDPDDIA